MGSGIFGWDLVISSVQSDIKDNEDILLCFTHLVLVSNEFKCIGLGESKVLEGNETQTEALPAGWSSSYAMRYVHQGYLYLLKATKMSDALLINLVRVDERTSSAIQFNKDLVSARTGSLNVMLPKHSEMRQQIMTELINKLVASKMKHDGSSQTPPQPPAASSTEPPRNPPSMYNPPEVPLRRPIPSVGEFDLSPFGRNPLNFPESVGGGGMLFEPPRRGPYPMGPEYGMPPGAVPPGARFDPFRPPDVDRPPRRPRNHPDNDDFPPPDYDDMFM